VISKWLILLFGLFIHIGFAIAMFLYFLKVAENGIDHEGNATLRMAWSTFTLCISVMEYLPPAIFGFTTYLMWRLLSSRKYLRKNENIMIAKILFSLISVTLNLVFAIVLKIKMSNTITVE
jgi:hypothetical protein